MVVVVVVVVCGCAMVKFSKSVVYSTVILYSLIIDKPFPSPRLIDHLGQLVWLELRDWFVLPGFYPQGTTVEEMNFYQNSCKSF